MSMRDDWKQTGTGLGHAFQGLGKSVIKSAKKGATKADEWANGPSEEGAPQEEQSMGEMWKDTGSGLGHAFQDLGKTVVKGAKHTADKAEDWADRGSAANNPAPAKDVTAETVVTDPAIEKTENPEA